ncbi:hypothetical protein [Microvirga sp. M2]|uniref:hypothetical protein n=1 Tax=Microvirga sp. M2 TaxID=3073270 RepID=UPI0039C264DB
MKKRGEPSERRRILEQEIKQIGSHVAAIDQVAKLFDPSILPTTISRKRLPASSGNAFTGENPSAIVLKTIRDAKEPISTAACSAAIARQKGLAEDDPFLKTMPSRISATLPNLEKRGRVRQAGTLDGRKDLWEIAR